MWAIESDVLDWDPAYEKFWRLRETIKKNRLKCGFLCFFGSGSLFFRGRLLFGPGTEEAPGSKIGTRVQNWDTGSKIGTDNKN